MKFFGTRQERKMVNRLDDFITVGSGLKMFFEKNIMYKE